MLPVNRIHLILLFVLTLAAGAKTTMAEPIGLMEKYALAADRAKMLGELIPGSEDFYFYHILHFQTTGQLEKAEATIKDWLAIHKGRETPAIRAMIDRQRLLTYRDSPDRAIEHLIRRLGVELNHAPPAVKGERRYPSELDNARFKLDRLVKDAMNQNSQLHPIGMQHLAKLFLKNKTAGVRISLVDFLKRVNGPYLENLDQLVVKELLSRAERSRRFGDVAAHRFLTLAELQKVARQVPSIADDNAFVQAILQRMRPSADSDPSQQPEVQLEYLRQVAVYVRTLPTSYNSLKGSSLYRLLEAELVAGNYDQKLFLEYLKLPRNSPIVHPEWARRAVRKANLGDDFMALALLPRIGDERPLVRAYLEHFLRDAPDTKMFAEYVQPVFLRHVFAESKLLAGVGAPEQWYKLLSPELRQSLRDRSELRLASQNKIRYASGDDTELIVDVKNIDELVVRVYEINTLAYHRTHTRPLNTDIDLDGLVATDEQKLKFNQPAVQRHRETLKLDSISGRGVWIVDLVGKGLRARALVRRGQINHVDQTTADGMVFTIIDEDRKPIPSAKMIVGSREFTADKEGHIVLPPVVDQIRRRAIITDGVLAAQVSFDHLHESYELSVGMHLDRTLTQSGSEAQLLIRPRLLMSGQLIAPSELKDVSVTIQATDIDNLKTTSEIEDIALSQTGELVVPFRVPARLANLNVTVQGTVTSIATAQQKTLRASGAIAVASIRKSAHTYDAFLTRNGKDYVVEVRGRSGEAVPNATVSISVDTDVYTGAINQTLQSDERGQVNLGPLNHVSRIRYSAAGSQQHDHDLELDVAVWPNLIHATTESDTRLALASDLDDVREKYRLLEIRGGGFHVDHSKNLRIENGLLSTGKLSAGDYQLVDRETARATQLVVVEGPMHGLVAAGKIRHLSVSPSEPLGIQSVKNDADGLKVQLSGDTKLARVHLYVSRYFDKAPIDQLNMGHPSLHSRQFGLQRCGYISDLRLGDEYQYVLRRRYAAKYPGVMLPQPGLILNPWETEETSNSTQSARAGDAPHPSPNAPMSKIARNSAVPGSASVSTGSSDFDFLADAGVLLPNLRPDKNGLVSVPKDLVAGMPLIHVVVSDPVNLLQRVVSAPLPEPKLVDLRLAKTLEIDKPMSFQRGVSVVSKDQPLDLESLGSAQLQVYGSVGALMRLYKTFVSDQRLDAFDELAIWHTLDKAAKLDAYSRLACHELHLFLWTHDREFFDSMIRPYLANKKEKQFIDHWLLEDELQPYTDLWRYNQLSSAERALLGMRHPESRTMVLRDLDETVAIRSDGLQDTTRLRIEGALMLDDLFGDDEMDHKKFRSLRKKGKSDWSGPDRSGGEMRQQASRELNAENESMDRAKLSIAGRGGMGMGGGGGGFGGGAVFYRELDSTKQWAESHWDRIRTQGGPVASDLIVANGFWADLASNDLDQSIAVSSHLLEPVENRHAALVGLAFCGLPLDAGEIGLPTEPGKAYSPEHAVAVVTKRLTELETSDEKSSILIGQRFARLDQPSNQKKAAAEPNEFLIGVGYKGQTVVSNPTADRLVVDVFWQIPAGSIPLGGSQFTDSRTITLQPFAVQAIEYQFYFPKAGEFAHYPATVSSDGDLIARGGKKQFEVVETLTEDDRVTWSKMARSGTPDQIREFLGSANLRELNWLLVAHRMKDQEVYKVIIKTLSDANLVVPELWAYSLKHRDEPAISSYLSVRSDLVDRVGPVLNSELLDVQPIEQRSYEFLEYAPLVRARIHQLGQEHEILNPTFLSQYRNFMRVLSYSQEIGASDHLTLAYYLLLQNRIGDAIKHFGLVQRDKVQAKLQFDYASAYFAMHREDYGMAEKIASKHAKHPIPRWANRFAELGNQLRQRQQLLKVQHLVSVEDDEDKKPDSIKEGSGDLALMDRQKRQAAAADLQPEVIVRVEGNSLRIDHRRAKEVKLNLYGVDLELLFSKAPFVREDLQRMAMVRPSKTETLEFDEATGTATFDLGDDLNRQTLLVEVVAGAARSTALYYGGQMTTYVSESFGQLQTTDTKTQRPISTAYVKVYARYANGSVRFYKDGYTDSRGRFDYSSISASDAKGASRFAILVLSDEKGATLHDIAPPTR